MAQGIKICLQCRRTESIPGLGENSLEKGLATHSSILTSEIHTHTPTHTATPTPTPTHTPTHTPVLVTEHGEKSVEKCQGTWENRKELTWEPQVGWIWRRFLGGPAGEQAASLRSGRGILSRTLILPIMSWLHGLILKAAWALVSSFHPEGAGGGSDLFSCPSTSYTSVRTTLSDKTPGSNNNHRRCPVLYYLLSKSVCYLILIF